MRSAVHADQIHAESLELRTQAQHAGRKPGGTVVVEEIGVPGEIGENGIEIEIPHRARAQRAIHVEHDAPAHAGLDAHGFAETLRGLRAIAGVVDARAIQRMRVELIVDEEEIEARIGGSDRRVVPQLLVGRAERQVEIVEMRHRSAQRIHARRIAAIERHVGRQARDLAERIDALHAHVIRRRVQQRLQLHATIAGDQPVHVGRRIDRCIALGETTEVAVVVRIGPAELDLLGRCAFGPPRDEKAGVVVTAAIHRPPLAPCVFAVVVHRQRRDAIVALDLDDGRGGERLEAVLEDEFGVGGGGECELRRAPRLTTRADTGGSARGEDGQDARSSAGSGGRVPGVSARGRDGTG